MSSLPLGGTPTHPSALDNFLSLPLLFEYSTCCSRSITTSGVKESVAGIVPVAIPAPKPYAAGNMQKVDPGLEDRPTAVAGSY